MPVQRPVSSLALLAVISHCAISSVLGPVAVTGATGKLGRAVVQQLVAKSIPCKILVRRTPAAEPSSAADATPEQVLAWLAGMPGVNIVQGDVTNRCSGSIAQRRA